MTKSEMFVKSEKTGLDMVTYDMYEHMKYGGKSLQKQFCGLLDLVIQNCLIHLVKGGNTNKTDPKPFRGISLAKLHIEDFRENTHSLFRTSPTKLSLSDKNGLSKLV